MDKRILFVALIFIIFFGNVFAVLDTGSLKIFAVTEDGKGMAADLRLDTFPGSGYVTFVTSNINGADHPLIGNDTQTTGNIALKIAKAKLVGAASGTDFGKYNYQFDIIANATEVDGPSAGAAMTLLAYSVLSERKIPTGVGLTGTIN
ncbi:MAG: S16 family serine protease, partial [Candidatus Izemoplasmatales bacterium]